MAQKRAWSPVWLGIAAGTGIGIVATAVLMAATGGPHAAVAQSTGEVPRIITTQGVGRVTAKPDVLIVRIGVETQGATAGEALTAANERANALLDALRAGGVASEDLATANVSLQPVYESTPLSTGTPRIVGYEVSNVVTVKVRNLDQAGALLDTAARAAGDAARISDVHFDIEDTGPASAAARDLAVESARKQAEQLAAAAGVRVGAVRAIRVVSTDYPTPRMFETAAVALDGAGSVPLEPGTQEITQTVEVIFDIA